jgi:hypothetical protein
MADSRSWPLGDALGRKWYYQSIARYELRTSIQVVNRTFVRICVSVLVKKLLHVLFMMGKSVGNMTG